MTSQKDVFLASEGDAWFRRNESTLERVNWSDDSVVKRVASLLTDTQRRVLEIGCGGGSRLRHLQEKHNCVVTGIDPSKGGVAKALTNRIQATVGTADELPFPDSSFDFVIFGFCLYLCDDKDLFRIAAEADRVLASPGWLLILDFDAPAPVYPPYHHVAGLRSRKMDYKSMFSWHPGYSLASYEKFHHVSRQWTDDKGEWVCLACLRKRLV